MAQIQESFANLARHKPEWVPAAFRAALQGTYRSKLRAILRDEKSLIGLANSFGGFLVCIAYQVMQ